MFQPNVRDNRARCAVSHRARCAVSQVGLKRAPNCNGRREDVWPLFLKYEKLKVHLNIAAACWLSFILFWQRFRRATVSAGS